ncbi:MAG: hypothetical protein HHAS10_01460 [Candidatus Altimarinota bacterium]
MSKFSVGSTLTSFALAAAVSTANAQAPRTIDLYPNIVTSRIRYITAEEARANNVAHMVMKVRGEVAGICHFNKISIPIQDRTETFIGTAKHCVTPGYKRGQDGVDYILARSLTRLYKEGSGISFETTDNPRVLNRSSLYGGMLHMAQVHMHGCLPDGDDKNSSTCFQISGRAYMDRQIPRQATVYISRQEYIDLLKKSGRTCEEAVITGVSGNSFKDENGDVVGFASTASQACKMLYVEDYLNEKGLPIRVNAFPVTFEPIREAGNGGKSSVILN